MAQQPVSTTEGDEGSGQRPPYRQWAELLIRSWRHLAMVAIASGIVTVAVTLLIPNSYRSSVVLLPDAEKGKLAGLGGLSDLASLAGVNIGGDLPMAKLYPTVVRSEAVLKPVILQKFFSAEKGDSLTLIEVWDIDEATPAKSYEVALRMMRKELIVTQDNKTNVLTLSIDLYEPQMAADVVNAIALSLDRFISTKRRTNASEQRRWIEARLSEVSRDLRNAEDSLKSFREANRSVVSSPRLLLEQERLLREVTINVTLFTELKKQYELARIEEVKNIPIINVMDPGRPAALKESPRRAVITILATLLCVVAAAIRLIVLSTYGDEIRSLRVWMRELLLR